MTQSISNHDLDASSSSLPSSANSNSDRLEILRRLAALVAVGEAPLPHDVPPDERKAILAEAGRLRRDRLIRFIARAIALDIEGAGEF
jgi:hypothetical protein